MTDSRLNLGRCIVRGAINHNRHHDGDEQRHNAEDDQQRRIIDPANSRHQARCLVREAAVVRRSSDGASRLLLRVSRSLRWKRGWRDYARRRHRDGAPVRSDHQAVPSHQDHQDHGKPDGADGNPCAHGDHPFDRTCPTLAGTVPLCVDIGANHREPDRVGPFGWGNLPARLPEGSLRQQSRGLPGTSHRSVTRLPERGGLRPPPHRSPTTG